MALSRRTFLRASSASSIGLLLPWAASSQAHGQALTYEGPFFFNIHAAGGWDPTLSFDPKLMNGSTVVNNAFTSAQLRTFGPTGMPYADVPLVDGPNTASALQLDTVGNFMRDHGADFVFLNGIDTATNNHEVGTQAMGCGKSIEALPALAALIGAQVSEQRDVPLAFIGAGGFEFTGGVVSLSRVNASVLQEVSTPNRQYGYSAQYLNLPDPVFQRVMRARNDSLNAQLAQAALPRAKAALSAMKDAQARTDALAALVSQLPTTAVTAKTHFPHLASAADGRLGDLDAALGQIELSLLSFKAGLSAAASLHVSGFDTHSSHNDAQTVVLGKLLLALRYLLTKATALGLRDKIYVAVTSEFGRTPGYNAGNGKDHWNITSAMLAGPRQVVRSAGRALGATDAGHKPKVVTPDNLTGSAPTSAANATRLKPQHLHQTLRGAFGLTGTELDRRFALPPSAPLPLFAA